MPVCKSEPVKEGKQRMTSKERVRRAIAHQRTDRVPAAFEAVDTVVEKLLKHYGDADLDALRRPVSYTHLTLPTT